VQRDLANPDLWRESLRVSQERRIRAARAETRERVGRRGAALALCGLAVMSGGAFAHERASSQGSGGAAERPAAVRGSSVSAVQKALGVTADGVYGPKTRRAVRSFQRREGLSVDGIVGRRTLAALGLRGGGSSGGGSSDGEGGSSGSIEAIAQCESGGNPRAISATGQYRGKYQFSRETWRAVGGKGDPAKASEAEQDRRAATLYEQSGSSAWPNCG